MERQLGSEYCGAEKQRDRATLTDSTKEDGLENNDVGSRGTLAMPYVLEQLPTGKYGIPKGDMRTRMALVNDVDDEDDGDSDLDNAIKDVNVAHTIDKLAVEFEDEDISDSQNGDANRVPDSGAEPDTDLPTSTSRQGSLTEKTFTEICAPRCADEGDKEFKNRVKQESKELKARSDELIKKLQAEREGAREAAKVLKKQKRKERNALSAKRRRSEMQEWLHAPDCDHQERIDVLKDIVARVATSELFEVARRWLQSGQDTDSATKDLMSIEEGWKDGMLGDKVVFEKVVEVLGIYAAIPVGCVKEEVDALPA